MLGFEAKRCAQIRPYARVEVPISAVRLRPKLQMLTVRDLELRASCCTD